LSSVSSSTHSSSTSSSFSSSSSLPSSSASSSSHQASSWKQDYEALKDERSQVLWRAVESVIPDARQRAVVALVGSPLTHERFLRRPRGTYGEECEGVC
jgi:phytoene dehydrogenase-like protein